MLVALSGRSAEGGTSEGRCPGGGGGGGRGRTQSQTCPCSPLASLAPVSYLEENEFFQQFWNPQGSWLQRAQEALRQLRGWPCCCCTSPCASSCPSAFPSTDAVSPASARSMHPLPEELGSACSQRQKVTVPGCGPGIVQAGLIPVPCTSGWLLATPEPLTLSGTMGPVRGKGMC